jgi:pimeloyl-ACP methyl ester carboxylesterase
MVNRLLTTLATALALLDGPISPRPAGAQPVSLPVSGFRQGTTLLPAGPGRRPVVVGLHGNFDRPEWFCESLARLVAGRAWVLCPRGILRGDVPREYDRWTFPGRQRVMQEIEAGLAALNRRHPARLDAGGILLAGFSLGAILAARFAVAAPARFPRLYLVEGGHQVWDAVGLRRFARGGGKGVVLGCGSRGCAARSAVLCQRLEREGVGCAQVVAPGLGHSYTAPLPTLARRSWETLVRPDPRWEGP